MKIHYFTLLKLLQIISLLWVVLIIAELIGYNFGVKTVFLLWFLIALLIVFIILETYKNKAYLKNKLKIYFQKFKDRLKKENNRFEESYERDNRIIYLVRWPIIIYNLSILPVIFYLKKTLFFKYFWLLLCCFWIARDIFLGKSNIEWPILLLTLIMLIMIRHFRIKGETLFLAGIFLIAVCPLFLIFHKVGMAERSSIWSYILLCTGTICLVWTSRASKKREKDHSIC